MTDAAGVMGYPISHSLSPRLHGYWIKKYALAATYVAWEVRSENLGQMLTDLPAICAANGAVFRGTNLTIPLKEKALEIVDILEPSAQQIGAVNTVIVGEKGKLIGRNTDGAGFTDSLAEQVAITRFNGATALVLGAGGASKAVTYALGQMGIGKILISNRTLPRAEELAAGTGPLAQVVAWEQRKSVLPDVDLLVNTTSLGMTGQPALDMPLDGLKAGAVVSDIVYVPLETRLLRDAAAKGHITVDGLGMLLHQAKAGFEAWFGVKPVVDARLRDFVLQGLANK